MTDSKKAAHDLIDKAYCRRKRLDGSEILGDAHTAIDKALEDALRGSPEERLARIVIENDIRREERTRIVKLIREKRDYHYQGGNGAADGYVAARFHRLADEIEGKDES